MFENQKKREKIWKYKIFYINVHLKVCLDIEFAAC